MKSFALKSKLGDEIPFTTVLLNVFVMFLSATLGDLARFDWIVTISGTVEVGR